MIEMRWRAENGQDQLLNRKCREIALLYRDLNYIEMDSVWPACNLPHDARRSIRSLTIDDAERLSSSASSLDECVVITIERFIQDISSSSYLILFRSNAGLSVPAKLPSALPPPR
jgi:hypothetical protein